MVFDWLKKLRKRAGNLVLPSREERGSRNQEPIDLAPYTPSPKEFLGQLAYFQLSYFELLTNALKFSPNTQYKAELGEAAARSFERHRLLSRRLSELGFDPTDAMDPYVDRIDSFHSETAGIDWHETLIKVYLVSGLLDDFYRRLAIGLPEEIRSEVERALTDRGFEKFAKRALLEQIGDDPYLRDRLAVYGRRLMGDTLLQLREAFDNRKLAGKKAAAGLSLADEKALNLAAYSKLEPLITELISAHSLRMDALGLTA